MLTVEELARLFHVSADTVRRQIREHDLPAEPKLGRRGAGYIIMADQLVIWLRGNALEGQARAVERYVAGLPEELPAPRPRRGLPRGRRPRGARPDEPANGT
jgi:excisionase family DNA binding protein